MTFPSQHNDRSIFVKRSRRRAAWRPSFTLMEVMLALGISAIIMAIISSAIHFHLKVVNKRRDEVERAQLARVILRRISDDIRGCVRYDPVDTEGIAALGLSGAVSEEDAGRAASGGGAIDPAALDEESDEEAEEESAASIASSTEPGLIGQQDALSIDVSRLPRLQLLGLEVNLDQGIVDRDLTSDVKTVAYYVRANRDQENPGGLVRRELDRAVTRYAVDNNNQLALDAHEKLLAPEVIQIEYRYHDGNEWLFEWDSIEQGGMPLAVEIAIWVLSPRELDQYEANPTGTGSLGVTGDEPVIGKIYRMVVHIPDRRIEDLEKEADELLEGDTEDADGEGEETR